MRVCIEIRTNPCPAFPDRVITFDEKRKLSVYIGSLDGDKLERVFEIITQEEPDLPGMTSCCSFIIALVLILYNAVGQIVCCCTYIRNVYVCRQTSSRRLHKFEHAHQWTSIPTTCLLLLIVIAFA